MKQIDYKALTKYIVDNNISLAESFEDWTKLALSLSTLGDEGRTMFHAIASISPKYKQAENERKFNRALLENKRITISTFIYMCQQAGIDVTPFYADEVSTFTPAPAQRPQQEKKMLLADYIPAEFCQRSLSYQSNFVQFLCSILDKETLESPTIERLMNDYYLGATKDKSVIFWQIDAKNNIRTGKVMQYNAGSGHRIKNGNGIDWVHSIMKKRGLLPDTFNMVQCLFGEHLLTRYPDKAVAVTESEKSALIGSAVFPSMIWLAVGGISNFTADRLKPLAGRKVIAFPDTDTNGETFRKWSDIAKGIHFAEITVSDLLEREATPQQKENKIDIADWLIENLRRGSQEAAKRELTACERMLLQFEQRNSAVMYLVDVFNLKPTSYTITVD